MFTEAVIYKMAAVLFRDVFKKNRIEWKEMQFSCWYQKGQFQKVLIIYKIPLEFSNQLWA